MWQEKMCFHWTVICHFLRIVYAFYSDILGKRISCILLERYIRFEISVDVSGKELRNFWSMCNTVESRIKAHLC